jgi:hypothetical protein
MHQKETGKKTEEFYDHLQGVIGEIISSDFIFIPEI